MTTGISGNNKKARKQNLNQDKYAKAGKKWDSSDPYKQEGNKKRKDVRGPGRFENTGSEVATSDPGSRNAIDDSKRVKHNKGKNKPVASGASQIQGYEREAATARMVSYARLELRPGGAGGGSIKGGSKDGGSQRAAKKTEGPEGVFKVSEGPQLSRAQKKNLRRSMKRAQNRGGSL